MAPAGRFDPLLALSLGPCVVVEVSVMRERDHAEYTLAIGAIDQ